jgi:hypothetical protein
VAAGGVASEGDGLGVEGEEGLFDPTEMMMILMSELPRIPFNMPDTWMVKEIPRSSFLLRSPAK